MPAIKSTSASAEKWARRAAQAGQDYEAGIDNPRKSWEEATSGAADAQEKGVQAAIANKSFAKGVKKAGNAKWQARAKQLGPGRYSEGVAVAKGDWEQGFGPYASAIQGTTLPPRGPKGDPRNYQRVQKIGDSLRAVKNR